MEKANRKQTIFNSKPLGVTAWIFLENSVLSLLKTVSMYWRMGFARNSLDAECGRLDLFFLWERSFTPTSSSRSSKSISFNTLMSAYEAAAIENSTGSPDSLTRRCTRKP